MPNVELFDELFIEYVQTYFFKHPDHSFSVNHIVTYFPVFYRDQDMITAAIHILIMRNSIVPVPLTADADGINRDKWTASKVKMIEINAEKIREAETKEADLIIKKLTVSRFNWPYIISVSSIIVALASLALTGLNTYSAIQKGKESKLLNYRLEVKLSRDTLRSQTGVIYLQQTAEKKDSASKK